MADFSQPSSQLYVGNLPWSTTEGELSDLFASFSVTSMTIPTGREGRSRGYAIVDMATSEQALQAIQSMDGKQHMPFAFERAMVCGKGGREGGCSILLMSAPAAHDPLLRSLVFLMASLQLQLMVGWMRTC
jgi:hypothetical protein